MACAQQEPTETQATCAADGFLKWLLVAKKHSLEQLKQKDIKLLAENFATLQEDSWVALLSNGTVLELPGHLQVLLLSRNGHDYKQSRYSTGTGAWTRWHYGSNNTCPGHIVRYRCVIKIWQEHQPDKARDCQGNVNEVQGTCNWNCSFNWIRQLVCLQGCSCLLADAADAGKSNSAHLV